MFLCSGCRAVGRGGSAAAREGRGGGGRQGPRPSGGEEPKPRQQHGKAVADRQGNLCHSKTLGFLRNFLLRKNLCIFSEIN